MLEVVIVEIRPVGIDHVVDWNGKVWLCEGGLIIAIDQPAPMLWFTSLRRGHS